MTFEQQWTEYDYNPFILFNDKGKVVSLNSEAQFLLGATTPKEVFELAKAYANVTFGFKTTFVDLEFGRYKIFGLTVGYENEEQIGIKLYQSPSFKLTKPKPDGELTNIFSIVDLCISTNSMSSDIEYIKLYDPTIPEIVINTNKLIKVLNKMYACVQENQQITTEIFYRIGEHIKFEEKKYSIFSISVNAENINKAKSNELKLLSESSDFYIDIKKTLTLNIPMITA